MPPVRIKSRPLPGTDADLRSPPLFEIREKITSLPDIGVGDSFRDVIKKLSVFFANAVTLPCSFEQLRTTSAGDRLRLLVTHLSNTCENPCIVNALLALKWHYGASGDDRGLNEARANACEIVAWRFLTHLSEREAVDFCLYEIPGTKKASGVVAAITETDGRDEESRGADNDGLGRDPNETSPLLSQLWSSAPADQSRNSTRRSAGKRYQLLQSISRLTMSMTYGHDNDGDDDGDDEDDPTAPFVQLNALEIAAIADAKRFLSQKVVQKIVTGIWNGDIVFWGRLEVDAVKKPQFYNPHTSDPYSRLRVPKYLKSFEIVYFMLFLAIFYMTLLDRNPEQISFSEGLFYVFLAAFAYDEMSEWIDAGSIFYVYDLWNVFDLIMICLGVVFAAVRMVGLYKGDSYLTNLAFDILALEAMFMVPRISSVLSLSPYWGTLIPCFKEMTKDFIKFMVLVVIIYLGFLTTFSLIGRDAFSLPHMTMILTKIFYGSSYIGFDIMHEIDPVFGPPLMLIFITLSSILLMGSLTGMLSNSFSRVISHSREEYLYVYSIYVLEASTSNRLTHFYPPFNLIALVIFRPLRLFLPSDTRFRAARIALLKATHMPIVVVIQFYEFFRGKVQHTSDRYSVIQGPHQQTISGTAAASRRGESNYAIGSVRGDASETSKRLASRPSTGYGPSSSVLRYDPRPLSSTGSIQPLSTNTVAPGASVSTPTVSMSAEEDTEMEAPSDTEIRIAELSAKIDRLTEMVSQIIASESKTK
ncbi:receptor-activated Ca2+-permeable cation channel [Grosmannia clavigera kw1407]|uniref:Receptor-activated Ca2+-permeable cation channel n=1 Tax=Grosmannia clavigera (strain kw1407 / UAMH 11150) TaxID=655863 RepID=F0X8D8_GROCL|nr:receptor-activated Ca2+-permeable cation channel [Grosmannia clavigera kw1407]EFX05889.1 receptor-activated Ca2+-permeable cation channel [Grosmannia clavigera kw1407]